MPDLAVCEMEDECIFRIYIASKDGTLLTDTYGMTQEEAGQGLYSGLFTILDLYSIRR